MTIHTGKNQATRTAIASKIGYVRNRNKTDGERLISCYECEAKLADTEFWYAQQVYLQATGKKEKKNDVLAYHIRQSFRPGEITPEEANRLGYELAQRFTKGNYAFIVCTHIDKAHIHNHIIFNAVSLDCKRKFRNFWGSSKAIRRLNDLICLENGYSIIEAPKQEGKTYSEWLGNKQNPSHRDLLRASINAALEHNPDSFDELLKLLAADGYEIKKGKRLSVRKEGQARFMRFSSLGDNYSIETLQQVCTKQKAHQPYIQKADSNNPHRINLLIDIPAKMREGKGVGFQKWASVHNAKQIAKSLSYLNESGITYLDELQSKADEIRKEHAALGNRRNEINRRIDEIVTLRKHILNYRKTRDVYVAYRKAGYSKKFYAEHAAEIEMHKQAKRAFDEMNVSKLPSLRALQDEQTKLTEERNEVNVAYQKAHKDMRELLTAKANLEKVLVEKKESTPEKDRQQANHGGQ